MTDGQPRTPSERIWRGVAGTTTADHRRSPPFPVPTRFNTRNFNM